MTKEYMSVSPKEVKNCLLFHAEKNWEHLSRVFKVTVENLPNIVNDISVQQTLWWWDVPLLTEKTIQGKAKKIFLFI